MKGWCVVTELGFEADNAGSCAKNPLQPDDVGILECQRAGIGVAVVQKRCYKGMSQDFGSVSR